MAEYQPMYDSFTNRASQPSYSGRRICVAANVFLPDSEFDPVTGKVRTTAGRHRDQAFRHRMEKSEQYRQAQEKLREREKHKKGLRMSASLAVFLLVSFVLVFGITLLWMEGECVHIDREIAKLETRAQRVRDENSALKIELDAACDEAVIKYAASQNLGMVPADQISPIHLEANVVQSSARESLGRGTYPVQAADRN